MNVKIILFFYMLKYLFQIYFNFLLYMSLSIYRKKVQYYKSKLDSLQLNSFETLFRNKRIDEIVLLLNDSIPACDSLNTDSWHLDDILNLYNSVNKNETIKYFFIHTFKNVIFTNIFHLRNYKALNFLVSTIETDKLMFEEIFMNKNFNISECTNLYELNLSNSEITELPNLSHLDTVKVLNISYNNFDQEDGMAFDETKMPNNLITLIANEIFGRYNGNFDFSSIKNLLFLRDLEYNDNSFNGTLENLPKLRNLSMSNHKLKRPGSRLYDLMRCTLDCEYFCTCSLLYTAHMDSRYDDHDPMTYNLNIIDYSNYGDYLPYTNNSFNFTDYIILLKRKINQAKIDKNVKEYKRLTKFLNEMINDNPRLDLEKIERSVLDETYLVNLYPDIPDVFTTYYDDFEPI